MSPKNDQCALHGPMSDDIKEIKGDVKKILENQSNNKLESYKDCSEHREEIRAEIQIERARVNKIFTGISVVLGIIAVANVVARWVS